MTSALPRYPFGLLGQDQPYTILNSSNLTEIAPKSFHLTKDPYRADRLTSLQINGLKYFTVRKGRTTTLMLLYDIFVNHQRYPNLTIEDYVLRHYLIGGTNLFACPKIQWKMKSTLERAQFIRHFHKKFYSL